MAASYLFLKPAHLPLLAAEMDADSVLPLDPDEARACLRDAFPSLRWDDATRATGDIDAGWVEFQLQPEEDGGALAMRCSLRADYAAAVQALCDRFGWVAFNEAAMCFQPHRQPMAV